MQCIKYFYSYKKRNFFKNTLRWLAAGVIFSVVLSSCFDKDKNLNFDIEGTAYQIAVPLINSKISIRRILDQSGGNTSLSVSPDGKVTVSYNGEVIRRTATALFPPFPGILDNPIPDTFYNFVLPLPSQFNTFIIDRAVFRNTKIYFVFEHDQPEDIEIRMRILNLKKNNISFEQKYSLKYNGNLPVKLTTPEVSIDGWEMQSNTNSIVFQYDAIRPNGEKTVLKFVNMKFDLITFSYIEGYLGYHIFKLDKDKIDIGLFNQWESGGFNFEDARIVLRAENAFGLPVRGKINKVELTTISNNTFSLISTFIGQDIDFPYLSFSEQGQTKNTIFTLDKTNSNIRELFNEKTKLITYDIDAFVNPDRDTTLRGFIDFDAFFKVFVAAEVPLYGYVQDLVLRDTLDFDIKDVDALQSGQLKIITANDFPAEIQLQVSFLNSLDEPLDVLFSNGGLLLPAAVLNSNGRTDKGKETINTVILSKERIDKIKDSKKIIVTGRLNSVNSQNGQSIWLYDDYDITLKVGAIFDYKK